MQYLEMKKHEFNKKYQRIDIYRYTVEPQLSEHWVIRIPRLFEQFVHSTSLNKLS